MRSCNEISPTVLFAFTLHVEFGAVSKPEGWTVTRWGKLPPQPQNALSREEHSSCWYLVHTWELNICLASPWVSPKCIIWDFCHTFVATHTHTHALVQKQNFGICMLKRMMEERTTILCRIVIYLLPWENLMSSLGFRLRDMLALCLLWQRPLLFSRREISCGS